LVKRVGKLLVCLAGGLVLNTGLRAEDMVPPDNPYGPIVTRNVFNLNPPPPPGAAQPAEPPPKITPNGIISILGRCQVLFKVNLPPKPGHLAREQTYILGEGQQQDDIEVVKIDATTQVVTFDNHGTVQELPLTVANASGPGPSGAVPGGPGPIPGLARPGFRPGGNRGGGADFYQFGQNSGGGGQKLNVVIGGANNSSGNMSGGYNANNSTVNASVSTGSRFGAVSAGTGSSSVPSPDGLTPAERLALMRIQQAQFEAQGMNPAIIPIPPGESGAQ
jgi:hypothetical protein